MYPNFLFQDILLKKKGTYIFVTEGRMGRGIFWSTS